MSHGVDSLDNRLVESRGALPDRPPAGDYVVVDVTHFSTTVVELLGRGAECVYVPENEGDGLAFRESHLEALVGCEHDTFAADDRYDFPNSASFVADLPVEGRPTSLVSTNGAATVDRLRGHDDVAVFVGTYANAGAVAAHLAGRDRPVTLVACGTEGDPTVDDLLGAVVVDRFLRGRPLDDAERDHFRRLLVTSKGVDYGSDHDRRKHDLDAYASAIDRRWVVPRLRGDRLVDATRREDAPDPERPPGES